MATNAWFIKLKGSEYLLTYSIWSEKKKSIVTNMLLSLIFEIQFYHYCCWFSNYENRSAEPSRKSQTHTTFGSVFTHDTQNVGFYFIKPGIRCLLACIDVQTMFNNMGESNMVTCTIYRTEAFKVRLGCCRVFIYSGLYRTWYILTCFAFHV